MSRFLYYRYIVGTTGFTVYRQLILKWRSTSIGQFRADTIEKLAFLILLDPSSMKKFIEENRQSGINQIVLICKIFDFSSVWDGYDLIGMLSRKVSISPRVMIQALYKNRNGTGDKHQLGDTLTEQIK